MHRKISTGLIVLALLALIFPLSLNAAIVGRFTDVRGQVNLLKGGKIPGLLVRVNDGVEPGDVIRTKSGGKAQLTMVDNSIITLAPESRLAIADYVYRADRGERRAVVRLFRGLVHTVVNRLIQAEEPDFIMETHTAIIGVRGTDWYTLLAPAFSSVYLVQGTLGVRSNVPTVPALLLLQSMQFTQVPMGKQPYLPQPINPEMVRMLEHLMDTGLIAGGLLGPGGVPSPAGQPDLPLGGLVTPDQRLRQEYIPPLVQPTPQMPAPTPPSIQAPTPVPAPAPTPPPVPSPSFSPSTPPSRTVP
jgi:hypothetical protein